MSSVQKQSAVRKLSRERSASLGAENGLWNLNFNSESVTFLAEEPQANLSWSSHTHQEDNP